jgi:hypothetical protein
LGIINQELHVYFYFENTLCDAAGLYGFSVVMVQAQTNAANATPVVTAKPASAWPQRLKAVPLPSPLRVSKSIC